MKLRRMLTALVLVAAISATWAMAAQAGPLAPSEGGPQRRALPNATSLATSTDATAKTARLGKAPRPAKVGSVIVRFKNSPTTSVLSEAAQSAETSTGSVRKLQHSRVTWSVPKGRTATEFAEDLEDNPAVEYAVPDYERKLVLDYTPPTYPPSGPNDPDFTDSGTGQSSYVSSGDVAATYFFARSWWLRDIRASQAWALGYTGPDIVGKYPLRADGEQFTVAVIDSGLYSNHPDNGINVVPGRDFFDHEVLSGGQWVRVQDADVTPVDPDDPTLWPGLDYSSRLLTASHGTCVSGEIGATANNGIGTVGVGYDTRVIVHKIMGIGRDGDAALRDSAITDAIFWSVDVNKAKVINMSLGGYEYSQDIANAVNYAYSKGCIIVAAKGNDGSKLPFYPASNAHVISVGALDRDASGMKTIPAYFTNYARTSLDIMAPGTFVWGLTKPDINLIPDLTTTPGYYVWDGTSMAAPVVSGAVAWLWRAAPALTNAEITSEVLNSAPKGPASSRFPSGYRKLDMAATYARLKADFPLLTKPVLPEQTVASLGNVPVTWHMSISKQRGVTYRWWADTDQSAVTPSSRVDLPLGVGDHYFAVKPFSNYNWDDGTAMAESWVHVVPAAEGTSTWLGAHVAGSSATYATPAYHISTTIDATLRDASSTPLSGASVKLQSSTDGAHWVDVSGGIPTNLPSGVYRSVVTPSSRRWYRFAFAGSGGVLRSVSSATRVTPGVYLSTPSAKSSISHTKKLSVTGKLMPAHSTSSRVVKIKIKRWNGHRWADYSSIWTRVTRRNSSYSAYAVSFKLKKGGYRLYAYAPADAQHATTTSGYRSVTVK